MDAAARRPDLGLPPGSAVYVGDRDPEEMAFSIIGYDPAGAWVKTADTLDELLEYRNSAGNTWINVNGLKDTGAISRLAEFYHIHPLTVEDILNTEHRPKVEEFDEYLFITFKSIFYGNGPAAPSTEAADPAKPAAAHPAEPEFEQISLLLTKNTVITFQEVYGDSFDMIRRRILNNLGRIRRMGVDYLAYRIIDAVVDEYFLMLDTLGAEFEDFEDRALDERDRTFVSDIQRAKQNLFRVRRAIWPLRESLAVLARMSSPLIGDELDPFLADLQGNAIQAAETVESYRELLAGVREVSLSTMSNRMNSVMKVLTIISTIFIPLTFIAGVYGMNFEHMPELVSPYGYPITWGIMILIAVGMLLFFKRRRWI